MKKQRKIMVLREVECGMDDIRKGDIFRSLPAGPTDIHSNPNMWYMATEDGEKLSEEEGYGKVMCKPVSFVTSEIYKPYRGIAMKEELVACVCMDLFDLKDGNTCDSCKRLLCFNCCDEPFGTCVDCDVKNES